MDCLHGLDVVHAIRLELAARAVPLWTSCVQTLSKAVDTACSGQIMV